jgi:hypothetical protein
MALGSRFHDGIAPHLVPFAHALRTLSAQQVHDLGVALLRREHQGRLVALVPRDTMAFMAELQEQLADHNVVERSSEVKRGVGEPVERVVGVLEECRVGFEDA